MRFCGFVVCVAMVTVPVFLFVAAASAAEAPPAPHVRLQPVGMAEARWTAGFWADRFRLCHEVVIPEMTKALLDPSNSAQLANFRVGAGLEEGPHRGTNWGDGDCYKWIEAQAWLFAVTRDPALDRTMDHWIDLIARTQADDGYIGTQTQLNPEKERWGQRSYHELYNMGHLMTAAAVHHRATGKDTFLAVARKLADYLYGVFQPRPKHLAHFGWNPSNIMGLVDLYRVTGERRYLELAGIFVDMRGSVPWPNPWIAATPADPNPGDQNQDRMALRKETMAVGHAVTAAYLWCGAADVAAETGEKALGDALVRLWTDVTGKRMYVTGAIGAYHHGVSPRGDKVHEAFGHEFELPQRTAYNETCANIGNAMWNRRMLLLSGDARYADVMERVLYNSGLAPMSVDGTRFCYCNPLARRAGVPLLNNDTPRRWFTHKCYCCPPSVARTLAKVHSWAYAVSDAAVWVNLYGGSTLETHLPDGSAVALAQATDYPWDGKVTLTVRAAPAEPMAVMLRIPGWADGATVRVNGEPLDVPAKPGAYAEVRRRWTAGDVLTLDLPMEPVLVEANPLVETAVGQAAVMRGPVVYCLESIDLPEGVAMADVRLPRRPRWTVRHEPDLLAGVTVLETEAAAVPGGGPWQGLYRRLPEGEPRPIRLRLIPYYAWNNRDETEMTVWLPLL